MAESPLHRHLVRRLVSHARFYGVRVPYAALPGWPEPPVLNGHRPDMIGITREGRLVLGEAEPGSSLTSQHTLDQLAAFIDIDDPNGLPAILALAVPGVWAHRATQIAVDLGVEPDDLVVVPVRPRVVRYVPSVQPMQRGGQQPVQPGVLMQRGRANSVPGQAALNAKAVALARQLLDRRLGS